MVERIMFDDAFYKEVMEGICHIFIYGMLPEIIGKWFTRRPVADSSGIITTPILSSAQAMKTLKTSKVRYYCSQPNYSTMSENLRATQGQVVFPSCHKLQQQNKEKRNRPSK